MCFLEKSKSPAAVLIVLIMLGTSPDQAHAILKCEATSTAADATRIKQNSTIQATEDIPVISEDQVISPVGAESGQEYGT